MGKGIHITNTVILGLIAIPLTIFLFTSLILGFSLGFKGMVNPSTTIYFLIWISSVCYFLFLIRSFKKCNIENKSFKWAFYLNIIWIVLAILLFLGLALFVTTSSFSTNLQEGLNVIDRLNNFTDIANIVFGIIYLISFIVFIIGYFKNKKDLPAFSES